MENINNQDKKSFEDFGLSQEVLKVIKEIGYDEPTDIQIEGIPQILKGKNVVAEAQTGTGKTAAFALPVLERLSSGKKVGFNQVRALILVPTRELANQVGESVKNYGKYLALSSISVSGGVRINPQMMDLRQGVDILVATPGRLLDLSSKNALKFESLEILVLDEADKMLDLGFSDEIGTILSLLPKKRQNLLFSATFPTELKLMVKKIIDNPLEISVTPTIKSAESIDQWIYPVDRGKKTQLLAQLLLENYKKQFLVFTKTQISANRLKNRLEGKKIKVTVIHGKKTQGARTQALDDFKKERVQVMVATDLASRGIDISQLPFVINFDLPHVTENYIHRIGRTGRAGESGMAISLVCADESKELFAIERAIQQIIPRKEIEGFNLAEPLADSPALLPVKRKRPKKNKKKNTQLSKN